jgi:ABC-2 type transport system permease protein
MTIIFKIARTELRNLFFSPVAWFLAIAFFVQCAFFYIPALYPLANWQDLLLKNDPNWKNFESSLTHTIFLNNDGIFVNALQNLYLFIPLLTMGVLSREISSGTIKLLYSSPVKLRQIVLGKYLAVMTYSFLLVCIIGLFMISGAFNIRSVDYGLLLSAELGFFLLVCAYAAIGLFMSSLTTYQVVSAVSTFTIIFILGHIGALWQQFDFVRDLTWFLSISGRTEKMLNGLVTTKDVIYFLLVIYMFLAFTFFKLKSEMESKSWGVTAIRYITVIVTVLLIGYVSSRPALTVYWDTTACKTNTLHPRTQKIIKELDGNYPLEVTLYTNLLNGPQDVKKGRPEARNAYLANLWDPYLRFKPDIKFKYVYYSDYSGDYARDYPGKTEKQVAGMLARLYDIDSAMFIPSEEIRKIIDPKSENYQVFLQVRYKGRTATLRTFGDEQFWPDEELVVDALKYLVQANAPKVYFLTGNLERDIYKKGEREYSYLSIEKSNRNALINHVFEVDTLSLEKQKLPTNMDLLVIADPKVILGDATMSKIQQYVDKGGNMLIMGEPGKQYILNPLLKNLGVQLRPGTLVQLSKDETPDKVTPMVTPTGANLAEEERLLWLKDGLKKNDIGVVLTIPTPGATALSYTVNSSYVISPLLNTFPQQTWLKMGKLILDSVPPVFTPLEGDQRDPTFPTAVQLTRQINNKQQRIIVCGDADFTSNMRLRANIFGNAFYSWLTYGKYPQYLPQVYLPKDTQLTISGPGVMVLKTVYQWILPGLLLLTGIVLLIRRKRK